MKRLTLGQRIAAVGCVTLLTVTIALFYFISKGFSKDIAFASLERCGNRYQRPLESLLENFSQHELLARRYIAGDKSVQAQMAGIEDRTDDAMKSLAAVDAAIGKDLQFTPEGLAMRKRDHCRRDILQQEWEALKSSFAGQSAEASDKAHAHLVSDVRTMIVHAGDMSNLILDPDLDSYYLMDATLVSLPQTQDRLTAIEALGQDAAGKGHVGDSQRTQLAVAAAMLKEADLDRTMGDVATSLNEDRNFYGSSPTLARNLTPAADEYQKANQALVDLMQKLAVNPDAPVTGSDFAAAVSHARQASFQLWWTGVSELDSLLQQRMDHLAGSRLWALLLTALALLGSAGFALFVIRSTTRRLQQTAEQMLRQSDGIATAASQLAAASQDLASGASEQAASLQETSAASQEVHSMAGKNSESSRSAARLVGESHGGFADANRALDQMVAAINGINADSDRISKIIKVIDEIAFQTNILALNAAVEAARAGEAGMGFAVVADEVRNLAQRCAQAARDTAELIEGSISRSADGRARVDQVAAAIRGLSSESEQIRTLVDEVSIGSEEQTRGIDQVSKALVQMEQVTQKNAAISEESASAVAELHAQSESLKRIVAGMTEVVGGRR